ncbi:hypothetical protein V7S43_005178 [Phytophthora oleae]|uniref:Crinkler effector protein N-terminal domain-containing protein n=1 Tax=Phytophthora oleae TaxID=2107226 RepID=A0ABD3FXW7_9STRA
MRETSKLNNSKLFGPGVSLGEGVIHVLVVLPSEMNITLSPDHGRILTLFCTIVGKVGSPFCVDIDENKFVDELKDAIKEMQMYQFLADELHLFLAKKNNEWLDGTDATALRLDIHGHPQGFTELMNPLLPLKDGKHFGAGFRQGEGQIQVLVVLPFGATINIKEGKGNAELKLYQERGKSIQDNCGDYCRAILEKSTRYTNSIQQSHFRLFVWKGHRRIYSNFKSLSSAFKKVTRDDEPMSKAEDGILNCGSRFYEEESLWAYGFILVLLKYSCLEDNRAGVMLRIEEKMSLYVEKCNLAAVTDFRERMKADGKRLPFFVLDEMTPSTEEPGGKNLAAFQRNVFRACGLVVVVMGTDAKVINLVRQSAGSSVDRHHWMTIFPRFPPIQPIQFVDTEKQAAWDNMQTQYPVLKIIAEKSRGRFSRFFTESVVEYAANAKSVSNLCDLLDEAFSQVHRRAVHARNFMNKEMGPEAQMMAISYTNAKKRSHEAGTACMHLHFANLVDKNHQISMYRTVNCTLA